MKMTERSFFSLSTTQIHPFKSKVTFSVRPYLPVIQQKVLLSSWGPCPSRTHFVVCVCLQIMSSWSPVWGPAMGKGIKQMRESFLLLGKGNNWLQPAGDLGPGQVVKSGLGSQSMLSLPSAVSATQRCEADYRPHLILLAHVIHYTL